MLQMKLGASAGALALGLLAGMSSGCEDLRCCNSCGRNYYLLDADGGQVAWLENVAEGGNECEIDDVPKTFEDGDMVVIRARVEQVRETSFDLEMLEGAPVGAEDPCPGTMPMGAQALAAAELEVGEIICVSAEVESLTLCTQLGCAGS